MNSRKNLKNGPFGLLRFCNVCRIILKIPGGFSALKGFYFKRQNCKKERKFKKMVTCTFFITVQIKTGQIGMRFSSKFEQMRDFISFYQVLLKTKSRESALR